ncbi:MAG: hypothetical protein A2033_17550 [Bacteroidetes bacterium GWA2_31_9]|nr:MAG: hypothetical protein A2033_17550 [Bacteroidetes bacterium GWA2_31_9]
MRINTIIPKKALNKAFLKQKPLRCEIDLFKTNLINLLNKVDEIEREENQKNHIRDFLRDTYYKDTNEINTKDTKDLVIHLGKSNKDKVGVIIEAKRPSNKNEMFSAVKPNAKAFHELVLYYLRERIEENNIDIKYCIATNIYEWYIIEASYFEKLFFRNKSFVKDYEQWRDGKKVTKDTNLFYNEIVKPFVDKLDEEITCTYFDIRNYEKVLKNEDKEDDNNLIALFKILSPYHLLKTPFANDSNSLNDKFYKELLHIIGLEEAKEGGKNIIRRKKENRNTGSLLENTISAIETEDSLHRIPDITLFGDNKQDRVYNVALELCITWINRILFLKLLEGQLVNYHKALSPLAMAGREVDFHFLNTETIHDFDELFKLFHKVLAVNINDRTDAIKIKYSHVPYLNSSLFEISELEDQAIKINSLDNSEHLELINNTILKDIKKKNNTLTTLDYLFMFLDSYDFASEGVSEIQEENKGIINASVLGKVFEKINGYKDGSIFTPGFITMYMCKQSIRLAVVQKFNEVKKWNIKHFDELYNKIDNRKEANEIINSLKICDPAVGSGHFLVSALNEIIAIKSELGILMDEKGKTLRDYVIEVVNDDLTISDENENFFAYNPKNKESNRVQKTLFHEKQTIIENCLFGVDINPNSVKICRLRLWIELLKNAYYKEETNYTELETLPNIDINIKCGNSLISRFALDSDLSKALKSIKYDIKAYRGFVNDYKNEKNRDVKRGLQKIIDAIKSDFRTNIDDPFKAKISKARGEVDNVLTELNTKQQWGEKIPKELKLKLEKATEKLAKLEKEKEDILSNVVYKNAFEWRFEFPEVLNDKGNFEGFDIVIGNPPYIQLQSMGKDADILARENYKTYTRTGDIYSLFYEKGNNLLKNDGILSFITSNKWMRADYGLNTRKYITENSNPFLLIDFGMRLVFENATVLSNILMFTKSQNLLQLNAVRIPIDIDLKIPLENYFDENCINLSISENAWVIHPNNVQKIKTKVESQGIKLKDWDIKINRGILTGYNEAFIIDGNTKNSLITDDNKSAEFIKPILRGQDIKAWLPNFADLWVIYIPKGFTIKGSKSELSTENIVNEPPPRYGNMIPNEAWDWFKAKLPAIAYYLLPFKVKAENRDDKGDFWWEQRACSYYDDFNNDKIIYPNMTKFLPFVYDESGFVTNQKCFIITANSDLKYLTAFLNSTLFKFCFKDNFPELLGETFELSKVFFEQVPVKQISEKEQKPFIAIVDQILEAKKQNKDSSELEKQIDTMVYMIYDLTDEEIWIVEGL